MPDISENRCGYVDEMGCHEVTLQAGFIGQQGYTFRPRVEDTGEKLLLSWENDGGLENPETVDIKGVTYTPTLQEEGDQTWISWENDGGLPNPQRMGIRGGTFTPVIDDTGEKLLLSWRNDRGLENPKTIDVKGVTYTPSVAQMGQEVVLSWTNDGGLPNPLPMNIRGAVGEKGDKGTTFTPLVEEKEDGRILLWWENDGNEPNPFPVNVRGDRGLQGERGIKGDKGDKGDTGEKGDRGDTGAKGEKGDKGIKGDKGDKGEKGEQGEPGLTQELVAGENITIDSSDPSAPVVSASVGVQSLVEGNFISVDASDPSAPVVSADVGVVRVEAGDNIIVDDSNPGKPIISAIGGGATQTPVTYAELIALINTNALVAGSQYLLTDYVTQYQQPVTNIIKTSDEIEPLVLTAVSNNALAVECSSLMYPNDIVYYDVKNNKCEDNLTARNGFILRRIDTKYNIDMPDDWRNILWARFKATAPVWTSGAVTRSYMYQSGTNLYITTKTGTPTSATDTAFFQLVCTTDDYFWSSALRAGLTLNTTDYAERYTFNANATLTVKTPTKMTTVIPDNITVESGGTVSTAGIRVLSNNVWYFDIYRPYNVSAENGFYSNTFGSDCSSNTFGSNCYGNIFGSGCNTNTFGGYCTGNTTTDYFQNNHLLPGFYSTNMTAIPELHNKTYVHQLFVNSTGNKRALHWVGNTPTYTTIT